MNSVYRSIIKSNIFTFSTVLFIYLFIVYFKTLLLSDTIESNDRTCGESCSGIDFQGISRRLAVILSTYFPGRTGIRE